MALSRWDPFNEMTSLRQAMDRLMEDAFVQPRGIASAAGGAMAGFEMDVMEKGDAVVVKASLPGVKPEDVHVTVEQNVLTIRGETRAETDQSQGRYHHRERRVGRFARSVLLPTDVDPSQCDADFEHGVLTVTLPKAERSRSRQIPVRGARGGQGMIEGQTTGGGTSGQSGAGNGAGAAAGSGASSGAGQRGADTTGHAATGTQTGTTPGTTGATGTQDTTGYTSGTRTGTPGNTTATSTSAHPGGAGTTHTDDTTGHTTTGTTGTPGTTGTTAGTSTTRGTTGADDTTGYTTTGATGTTGTTGTTNTTGTTEGRTTGDTGRTT